MHLDLHRTLERTEVRITLLYSAASVLWIISSDTLVNFFFAGSNITMTSVSILKGWGFVLVTSLSLFGVLTAELRKRDRLERQLREERDISPVGIVIFAPNGHIKSANARARAVLGLPHDELLHREYKYNSPAWIITDLDGNPLPEEEFAFAQVQRKKASVRGIRHGLRWADGKRVLLELNAAPLLDSKGNIESVVLTLEDITEEEIKARLLRESEARYHSLVEIAPYAIYVLQNERIAFANSAAAQLLGTQGIDDLIGRSPYQIIASEDRQAEQDRLVRLVNGETHLYPIETIYRRADGVAVPVEVTAVPFSLENQPAIQICAIDIGERKLSQARILYLNRLYAVLSQINQAILRVRDPDILFSEACRIAVEYGQFKMAWIGIVDEDNHWVRAVSYSGTDADYVKDLGSLLETGVDSTGGGMLGEGIQT